MNKIAINKAFKRNKTSYLVLFGLVLSLFGTIQAATPAQQSKETLESYDYTLQNHSDQVSPIKDKAYLDIDEMPKELTLILKATGSQGKMNEAQLLALVAEDVPHKQYYKYLFASNGLLRTGEARQKAHDFNYHLVKAPMGPVIWQVLSFLEPQSNLKVEECILPKDTKLCLSCGHMCMHLFGKKLPVHKEGCQGEALPMTAAPTSAIACFYSDRFSDQQRRLVISQIGDQAFPDPKKVITPQPTHNAYNADFKPIKPVSQENQLHMAVQLEFPIDTIKLLLTSPQININALDSDGKTPLDYAKKDSNIYALLVGHDGKTREELKNTVFPSSAADYDSKENQAAGHTVIEKDSFLPDQILIPANGNCLYSTIIMGYLLPVKQNGDEMTARIDHLFGMQPADYVNELCQILENLTNYLPYLYSDAFDTLVTAFMANMQIKKGTWGGSVEIQTIANKLKVNIQTYYPDPSNPTNLVQSDLIKPAKAVADITLDIVRDKVHSAEVLTQTEKASAADNPHYQHYRLKYTLPPSISALALPDPPSHQVGSSKESPVKKGLEEWFTASRDGDKKSLENLCSSLKINVDERDEDHYTALIKSAEKGHLDCVKYLLGQGADINAVNEWQNTALIWSARKGHLEVVKHLLNQGANIDACNGTGYTALLFSAQGGHLDCVKHLLEHGADINAANKSKQTALVLAARFGHLECVKWLNKKNTTDVKLKQKQIKAALEWAKKDDMNNSNNTSHIKDYLSQFVKKAEQVTQNNEEDDEKDDITDK